MGEIDRDVVSAHLMEPVVAATLEGEVVFANERFLTIGSFDRDGVLGSDYSLLSDIVEAGFEAFVEAFEAVARGDLEDERVELAMLHPEAAPVPRRLPAEARLTPIVEDGSRVGVLVVLRNVSQRKEQEQALRRSQRRFEAVLDSPDSFIGVLEPDGTVVEVNESALELIDAAPEDVVGEPFPETPWWAHSASLQEEIRENIERAADGEYVRFEGTHIATAGHEVAVDGVIRPVTDPDGEVVSLIAEGRDVTRRRQYARELEQKNERLEEFASVLTHDLRNPLNVAAGRTRMAMQECDSEHLTEVAKAHDRMAVLIEDLLRLAREGEAVASVEPVDLGEVVRDCWAHVDTGEASLAVETDRRVRADRSRLQQLLENLLRNAVEHGDGPPTVTVGELEEGFYVEDDGPGVPPDAADRLFEHGYTTSPSGTGFGLSIVAEIAEAHGWTVGVTEGEGGGARFEVRGVERPA